MLHASKESEQIFFIPGIARVFIRQVADFSVPRTGLFLLSMIATATGTD